VLAYLSDMTLLDTATFAHGRAIFDPISRRRASTTPCGSTAAMRSTTGCSTRRTARRPRVRAAFTRGALFARDGTLIASVAQEGLIRLKRIACKIGILENCLFFNQNAFAIHLRRHVALAAEAIPFVSTP
jgi:hypothetical protein